MSSDALSSKTLSCSHLVQQVFTERFGYESEGVFHGPGRVNLIGDHTDYNDGFVLPAAINFGTDIAAAKRADNSIRVIAIDCDMDSAEFALDSITFNREKMWVNYVAGTLQALLTLYPDVQGADLVVSGNVPLGAGLSSSASFEIAILKTMAALYQLPLSGEVAAQLGQAAENTFVGCNCGIMDQFISALGQAEHAMLLDCRSLTYQDSPVPQGLEIVIVNSNVQRGLVDSEYNTRRTQCEQVAQTLQKPALRDVSLDQLSAHQAQLDPVSFRRARHVITENARTEQALVAMQNHDIAALSALMKASHQSLKDDFEVSTKELDGIVTIIDDVIGQSGGVRMTGGGFGGCVVALVPTVMVESVVDRVKQDYPAQFGLTPEVYLCSPATGAFRE